MNKKLAASAAGILLALISLEVSASDDGLDDNAIPTVLTPTRLKQSLAEVPSSVTIITQDMLKTYGITSIPDALRLVPGMEVTQVSGNDFRINYHGTSELEPRRMEVLIDGMSVYRPAIARVDWKALPIVIEDVDRIEVTRSPNSATYGPNSMMAIVNIITKKPTAVEGTSVLVSDGSFNSSEAMARYSGHLGNATTFRITLDRQRDDGEISSTTAPEHDGTELDRVNFRSITNISNTEEFDAQVSLVKGVEQVASVERYQVSYPDQGTNEYYINLKWNKSLSENDDIQVQAYTSHHDSTQSWTTCPPRAALLPQLYNLWSADPAYVAAILAGKKPTGGTAYDNQLALLALTAIKVEGANALKPACLLGVNQNYTEGRSNIELQDTYVLSPKLRAVMGIAGRQDIGDSQTYLAGRVVDDSYSAFANVEYKPSDWSSINAGGYFEHDTLTGGAFSPRLALNVRASENHSFRFIVSKGTRLPDIFEQRAIWTYSGVYNNTPVTFYEHAQSPDDLTGEKITSTEIGYFGNFPQAGLQVDAKVYDDELSDLISQKLEVSNFAPTNTNSLRLKGFEMQVTYQPTEKWSAYATYSKLLNEGATSPYEITQVADNMGVVGVARTFDNDWKASALFQASSGNGLGQTYYQQESLVLTKKLKVAGARVTATASAAHLDNPNQTYLQDVGNVIALKYTKTNQAYGRVLIEF